MLGDHEMSVWVEALIKDPTTTRPDEVPEDAWREVRQLARLQSWLEVPGPPPLTQDPVAAMLGLVPDAGRVLDGSAIKRARTRAGLRVSEVAERLRAYGWQVTSAEVRDWEARPGQVVAPALSLRVAGVLGTHVDEITQPAGRAISEAVTEDPRWLSVVERFARLLDLPAVQSESRLIAALSPVRFRNETPSSYLDAAEDYVARLESSRED